jgi:SAM-dependent methyltransferase
MGCIVCNGEGINLKVIDGFEYNICQNCGHVYQENLKDNKFYEHLPYESQWDNYETHSKNRANYIYNFCKDYIKRDTLHADIGCGLGGPMFFMGKLFNTQKSIGFTVDQDKTKFNKNLNIIYEDFIESKISDTFDFVTMVHVLEHFPNPLKALHKLKNILKPGGYAYIEVPSFEWCEVRTPEVFCPVHISYFSFKQLAEILRNFGFTIISKKESKYWGNIKFLIKNDIEIPKYNFRLKKLKSSLIKLFFYPIFRLIKKYKKIKVND